MQVPPSSTVHPSPLKVQRSFTDFSQSRLTPRNKPSCCTICSLRGPPRHFQHEPRPKRAFSLDNESLQARITLRQVRLPRLDEQEHVQVLQSRLAVRRRAGTAIRRLEVHLVQRRNDGSGSRRHEAKQCESVVPRWITIDSQPMQPDPFSRHRVGGFPVDENTILCKPLTDFDPKNSPHCCQRRKTRNDDDQGDHNQAEQNPQTMVTRRRPRPRQEIAHTMSVLPAMRDRAKRSIRRRGRRAPTERLGVRAVETGVNGARRFPRRPSRRNGQGRNGPSLHPDGPADGASTGSWPAHISKPWPLEIDRTRRPSGFP